MKKIVFLLEEPSMKAFLEGFLPRFMPELEFLCITHEGKQDLEKSIPRKLKAFHGGLFVIIRDNDGADCRAIKERLIGVCKSKEKSDVLIRIACQELESWYLGAMDTLAAVYGRPKLSGWNRKARYRNPDHLGNPSSEVIKLIPEFRKIEGARRMGMAMPLEKAGNCSKSFQVFTEGLQRMNKSAKTRVIRLRRGQE